ncbi:MAG: hypothetical protein ABL914_09875 [Novosphingobium sp.]|uniref:hypothetical protein n=1 Tax=Novosphingobium sp. TaxID=1874826 RepID=UPI0032BE33C0
MTTRRKVRILRLSWPVEPGTFAALLNGGAAALEADPWFARLLGHLRASNPLGDFGHYQAVAEVAPCWELFKPAASAQPTLGEPGETQVSTNLMVTIHVPFETPDDLFEGLLSTLVAEHPWEVPVIELSEAELLVR